MKHSYLAVLILATLSMCDESEVKKAKPEPPVKPVKEYPQLEGAVFVKSLPLFTKWNLRCGRCDTSDPLSNFNSMVPEYTGANQYQCGNADAGCVAVAMGQILYYWKTPGTIDWNLVKDSCSTRETAKLMFEAGKSVNMVYNVDQAGSSGISFERLDDIKNGFENFGFNSEYGEFNLDTLKSEIDNGRPVMLMACSGSFCHAWITTAYGVDINNNYYLFMNWGLNFNDWSSAVEWSGKGTIFDRRKTMVYGIRPL